MKIDDYKCAFCGKVHEDCWEVPETCGACGHHVMEKNWQSCKVGLVWGKSNRYGTDGKTLFHHGALDDPLTKIEMGLKSDDGSGIRTFNEDQAKYFREKALKGEDSPQLRKEILDVRDKNRSEWNATRTERVKKKTQLIQGV